ncbi:MAG TPA: ribbon-helix-helix domain-containing protein [Abditibacteriaceae bacterium]|jgi:hypothetical protein
MTKSKGIGKGGSRTGAGRPVIKTDGSRYNVYLSGEANALIDALAKSLEVSRSEAIEVAVKEAAKMRKIEVE